MCLRCAHCCAACHAAMLYCCPVVLPCYSSGQPRLNNSVYEMVLQSLLLSPEDHPQLLRLAQVGRAEAATPGRQGGPLDYATGS